MLTLKQHPIPGYRARTLVNAESADLTVAFASDFGTAGERLTRKAAGKRYIAIPLTTPAEEAGMILAASLRKHGASTLNVAGNGVYTLSHHGWTQESVNLWIYLALRATCQAVPIQLLRSGGQTGADLAGLVAACELSIPALGYFPKGFLQRGLDQVDRTRTPFEIQQQIDGYLVSLRNDLYSATQPLKKWAPNRLSTSRPIRSVCRPIWRSVRQAACAPGMAKGIRLGQQLFSQEALGCSASTIFPKEFATTPPLRSVPVVFTPT
ncbi:hypothetical protein O0O73_003142 [Pseudomonas aeruginosa]|nr:hypothetical protein [Pseudomonas aeruginosa]